VFLRCERLAQSHLRDETTRGGFREGRCTMKGSMRYAIPRWYYLATPAFVLLDYVAGVNIRVAVLDSVPLYKNLYYGLCILCGGVVFLRPRFSGLVALIESTILFVMTIVLVFLPYWAIAQTPDDPIDVEFEILTLQGVINLLIVGAIALKGMSVHRNALAQACGFIPPGDNRTPSAGRPE